MRSPSAARSRRSSLVMSSGATLAVKMVGLVLGYLVTTTLARLLSLETFGTYAYVLALVQVAALPAQFGLPNLIVREVATATITRAWGPVVGLLIRGHQLALGTAIVLAASLLLAWQAAPSAFSGITPSSLTWAVLLMPLLAMAGLRNAMIRGLSYVALGFFSELVLEKAVVLSAVLAIAWMGWTLTPTEVLASNVLAAAVSTLFGYTAFLWLWPARRETIQPTYHTREWLGAVIPLGLTQNMNALNAQLGLLILGALGLPGEVASLKVGSQLALIVLVFYGTLNSVLFPRVSAAIAAGEMQRVQRVLVLGARAAAGAGAAGLVGFLVAGPWIIPLLFGDPYQSAVLPTVLMALAHTIHAAFGFPAMLLTAGRHERKVTASVAVATGLNVVVLPLLAFGLGAVGAACATIVVTTVLNVQLWYRARKLFQIDTSILGRRAP